MEAKVIGLGGVSFVSGLEWRRSPGFSIGLSVRTAFLRVEATAGTNAHTTSGDVLNRKEVSLMFSFFFPHTLPEHVNLSLQKKATHFN